MKSNKTQNPYLSKSTQDLVELAKEGDQRAITQLYNLYINYITFEVKARIWNAEEAEEIIQDTFAKAFQAIDTFILNNSFGYWLKKIAINTIIDHVRKQKAERATYHTSQGVELSAHHANNDSAADNIVFKETEQEIKDAVEELSWKDRRIYNYRFVDNMKYSDIAEKLNVNIGTVKSHLHKVRTKLKQHTQIN